MVADFSQPARIAVLYELLSRRVRRLRVMRRGRLLLNEGEHEQAQEGGVAQHFMRLALEQAAAAERAGEVPVGALVVLENRIVGVGYNQPISTVDPTAHAEIVALRAAAKDVGNYRLPGSVLYVTVEPCLMCVGAMVHARVQRVVFGTPEPRAGALVSSICAHETAGLNHRLEVASGVLEADCRRVMQAFFERRRGRGGSG